MTKKIRKIAVMGHPGVGKSSLCIQFVQGKFVGEYYPTIENTYVKELKVAGQDYKLELIDTAGQDEYTILSSQYTMDINAYILVYSITTLKSFEIISVIYDKLKDMGKQGVPIILVGNKTDLSSNRQVTEETALQKAKEMNALFLEATATKHELVNDIFMKVIISMDNLKDTSDSKCTVS